MIPSALRVVRLIAVAAAVGLGTLLLTAAPASAAFTHPLLKTFGSFTHPSGIAIDESAPATKGNVLVADGSGSNVVDIFGPKGELPSGVASPYKIGGFAFNGEPSGLAFDNSATSPSKGDLYVADVQNNAVKKFKLNPVTEEYEFVETLQAAGGFDEPLGVAVNSQGDVYVADYSPAVIVIFNPTGAEIGRIPRGGPASSLAFDSDSELFVQNYGSGHVAKLTLNGAGDEVIAEEAIADGATGLAIDPGANILYLGFGDHITEYGPATAAKPEPEGEFSGNGSIVSTARLAVNTETHDIYTTDGGIGKVATFGPKAIIPDVTTGTATTLRTTATVNGEVSDAGGDPISECNFEYVPQGSSYSSSEAHSTPCTQGLPITGHEEVSAELTNLKDEAVYDYRLEAASDRGGNQGQSQTFETGLAVTGLTTKPATELQLEGATLNGSLDAEGFETKYFFQYGVEESYGQTTAAQEVHGNAVEPVPGVPIHGLLPNHTYYYRIVATNKFGTSYGQDETVKTPSAPSIDAFSSSNVTASSAELHTQVNPEGFQTTYRFEYGPTSAYGTSTASGEVGSGTVDESRSVKLENLETRVYHFRVVAENEWGTTTTVDQTFSFYPEKCPNEARREETHSNFLPDCRAYELVSPSKQGSFIVFPGSAPATSYATDPARFSFGGGFGSVTGTNPPTNFNIDNYVATRTDTGWVTKYAGLGGEATLGASGMVGDLSFDRVIDFDEPNGGFANGGIEPESRAPYVWSANDEPLGRWPADVDSTPLLKEADEGTLGAWQPSPDFSHLAFSSNNYAWETGGVTAAPGSAYDYNTATHANQIISVLPGGGNIPQQPGQTNPEEWISFPGVSGDGRPAQVNPGVSTDGSHILMSTAGASGGVELYMRIDDAMTDCVSCNENGVPADVSYVGMTSDGTKVFFTSNERLTNEDTDNSSDLYMWNEATDSLTDISLGNNGGGNTDACNPGGGWTTGCDVVPVLTGRGAVGDTPLAEESGDIYFYSPEQLDGSKGIPNQVNLYLYRSGQVHYVTTLGPGTDCEAVEEGSCGNGPIDRMDVSPNGSHVAFITNQQLSGYENLGNDEMYSYEPSSEKLLCVSCDPSGAPPVGGVTGADDGLFMSNDGRTFFYTPDALVPQDTNNLHDVYEYVEGRPQLISSGTSAQDTQQTANQTRSVGLAGVSADGVNVYFSTFATLVSQDENGPFAKYYDARTDGGFRAPPAALPCEAADECHGTGSSPPAPPQIASTAEDGSGGNWPLTANGRTRKKHKKRQHKRNARQRHKPVQHARRRDR